MGVIIRALLVLFLVVAAAGTFLAQLPLLVKSPYLHSWITAPQMTTPSGAWPSFWNGHITGWTSYIRVDGISYQWIGQTLSSRPTLTTNYMTPTRTIFSFVAGPIAFNVTYLSPIDPSDLVQQSLPFGYVYIDLWSLDGNAHSVQVYSDMTGEWLSSDLNDEVQWNTTQSGNVVCHRMQLSNPSPMVEVGDIAKDGTLFFAAQNRSGLTWQTGNCDSQIGLRGTFTSGQPLANTADTNFRHINDKWPALAFRFDLGNITQTDSSLFWAVGMIREPVVQYTTTADIQARSSYYWTAYSTGDDIITDVIRRFDNVRSKAIDFDNKVLADAGAISSNYQDLVSLSLRLVFAAMDFTIPRLSNGTLVTSDLKIFMKDVGASGRVNPVENIYAAIPAILYLNASLAGPLLEPLLEYQNSSDYKNQYAAPDLGSSYPKVQGNSSNTLELAIENCGSMLIMTLAHALKSGDGSLLDSYYDLLKGWADYLEMNTLHPAGYLSADGQSNPDLSNLALKGIVGLYAMGKISEVTGKSSEDASHFQSLAQSYASQWQSLAVSSGRINSIYGNSSSWGLTYNLYADRLLGSNLISNDTYLQQTQYYLSQVGSSPQFGFPYDSNDPGKAKSHWTMFTAASVTDASVRDVLVRMTWQRAIFNNTAPFPDTYDPRTGSAIHGIASPAQGAMFAPLALALAVKQISMASSPQPSNPPSPQSNAHRTNVGAIAGGIVGGISVILIVVILALFFRHKRRARGKALQEINVHEPFFPLNLGNDSANTFPEVDFVAMASNAKSRANYSLSFRGPTVAGFFLTPSPKSTGVVPNTSNTNHSPRPSPDIRTEMQQLRREVAELRTQQLQAIESPPLYEFGLEEEHAPYHNISNVF